MGIQGHSMESHPLICEWVAAGLIGEVREVDAWCDLSYYPWGHAVLEQCLVGPAQGDAARSGRAGLGPVDRPGGDAAVPSGLPSGRPGAASGISAAG